MPGKLRFGTAGWSYEDWRGIVYPRKTSTEFDPLVLLAGWFDLIEVNVTFYRPVSDATVRNWLDRVAHDSNFQFSLKAPRDLTHAPTPDLDRAGPFRKLLEALTEAGRLNAVLLQFPWSFRNDSSNRSRVSSLVQEFSEFPTVVEFRHASWDTPATCATLHDAGVALCSLDLPVSRDGFGCDPHVTAPIAYYRLHGRNARSWFDPAAGRDARYDYRYREEEYESLGERIQRMASAAEEVSVIGNNHFRGQAVVSALILKGMLTGSRARVPVTLLDLYPELAGHAEPLIEPGQQTLFS